MTKKHVSLRDLLTAIGAPADAAASADASLAIHSLANPAEAKPGDAAFLSGEAYLHGVENCMSTVLVVNQALVGRVPASVKERTLVVAVRDAMLAFAKASELFADESASLAAGVHSTAVVDASAKLGEGVAVGAGAVIGTGAKIGPRSRIYPGVIIGANVTIGADCALFPKVVLYDNVVLGQRVRIHAGSVIGADGFGYVQSPVPGGVEHIKIHHLGAVRLDDDVEIGANSCVDRGTLGDTIIGKGSKIDNHVQIGHNCRFDEGVIVCGSSAIAGSVQIGRNAVLAGFIGVANKTKIGAGVIIAAFSMVFDKEIPAGARWGGVPARSQKEWMRLQVLISRLPELFAARRAEKRQKEEV